jgi:Lar family restriction alleviation protein
MSKRRPTASGDILLPCPFCGSLRVAVFFSRNTYVECRACGTRGPQIGAHVETDDMGAQRATQKWNERASAQR